LQIIAGAALLTHEHPISGIAAGQHSGIKVAADFRGRKVGIPGVNGINHLIFMKWLQDRGVDPRSVKFERVLLPRMAASLRSGKIDAALPIEPFLSEIVQADAGYLISKFPGDREKPFVAAVYAMPRSWVEKNPQAARAFKEALREGAQWISGNEAAARKTQVHYLKISEDSAMTDVLPEFALDVRASDIEFWIDLCHRFKAIKGTVPVASVLAE
jgi:NitT/TauT family transport system substrate-binding protein